MLSMLDAPYQIKTHSRQSVMSQNKPNVAIMLRNIGNLDSKVFIFLFLYGRLLLNLSRAVGIKLQSFVKRLHGGAVGLELYADFVLPVAGCLYVFVVRKVYVIPNA